MVNSVFLEEANEQDVIDIYQGLSNVKRPSNIKHLQVQGKVTFIQTLAV